MICLYTPNTWRTSLLVLITWSSVLLVLSTTGANIYFTTSETALLQMWQGCFKKTATCKKPVKSNQAQPLSWCFLDPAVLSVFAFCLRGSLSVPFCPFLPPEAAATLYVRCRKYDSQWKCQGTQFDTNKYNEWFFTFILTVGAGTGSHNAAAVISSSNGGTYLTENLRKLSSMGRKKTISILSARHVFHAIFMFLLSCYCLLVPRIRVH